MGLDTRGYYAKISFHPSFCYHSLHYSATKDGSVLRCNVCHKDADIVLASAYMTLKLSLGDIKASHASSYLVLRCTQAH